MDILFYGPPHYLTLRRNELLQKLGRHSSQPKCGVINLELPGIRCGHHHVLPFPWNTVSSALHRVGLPHSRVSPLFSFPSKLHWFHCCFKRVLEPFRIFHTTALNEIIQVFNCIFPRGAGCYSCVSDTGSSSTSVQVGPVALHAPRLPQGLLFFRAEKNELGKSNCSTSVDTK